MDSNIMTKVKKEEVNVGGLKSGKGIVLPQLSFPRICLQYEIYILRFVCRMWDMYK